MKCEPRSSGFHWASSVFITVSIILGLHCTALAQSTKKFWCGEHPYDPRHQLSWQTLQHEVTSRIDKFRIEAAYEYIIDQFETVVKDESNNTPELRIIRETNHFYFIKIRKFTEGPEMWRDIHAGDNLLYDLGPMETDDQGNAVIPGDRERMLSIPCDAFKTPNSYKVSISYFAHAMRNAGRYGDLSVGQQASSAVATATYRGYKQFLYDGLAMWPWELLLNGVFVPDDFTEPPPRFQLTFLRPNVSLALRFDDVDDSALDYALVVEPIGYVGYVGEGYKSWWGVSPIVTLTSKQGVGFGALARWKNYSVGAAYHDNDNEVLLYVSIDLYKYVLGEDGRTNQVKGFLKGLEDKAKKKLTE